MLVAELVEGRPEAPEGRKDRPMVGVLTTAGETVCMLVADPVEGRPEAVEGC